MTVVLENKTLTASDLPVEWEWIRRALPGYDPEADKGYTHFDADLAEAAIEFIEESCTHVKGALAGKALLLSVWQKAIVACLFGYVRPDGTRRYREALVYVPRKNGKTTLLAALILLVMFTDNEQGAELYSAAADREQACLVYDQAKGMIFNNTAFEKAVKVYATSKSIVYMNGGVSYKAISADANTKHGYNTHFAVIDELHAQPNRELVDVLMTSTGSREQPLIVHITTADYARESICNEKLDYAKRVRDGAVDDNSFLPVIYETDADADWKDPMVWAQANPNLGVSVKLEYLERECQRAQEQPSFENTFKRLHLNIQTEQADCWLQMDKWDKCAGQVSALETPKLLEGEVCWAGLDLSTTTDISALVLYFPERHVLVPYFWIPRDNIRKREERSGSPWTAWARDGYCEATPGNVVDYAYIRARVKDVAKRYKLRGVGYDPWNSTQLAVQLQDEDGISMVEFRQGYASLNAPSKEFERLLVEGKLVHGAHPILRDMAACVAVKRDPAGNIKPDKKASTDRIDGIVASIMAVGMAMTQKAEGSIYSERGIRYV